MFPSIKSFWFKPYESRRLELMETILACKHLSFFDFDCQDSSKSYQQTLVSLVISITTKIEINNVETRFLGKSDMISIGSRIM